MDPKILIQQIGPVNLLAIAARCFTVDENFIEFTASNNPKIIEEVRVHIELMSDDTYALRVFNDIKEYAKHEGVYCDQLSELLDDIFG